MHTKVMRWLGLILVLSLGVVGVTTAASVTTARPDDACCRHVYQSQRPLGGRQPDRSQ